MFTGQREFERDAQGRNRGSLEGSALHYPIPDIQIHSPAEDTDTICSENSNGSSETDTDYIYQVQRDDIDDTFSEEPYQSEFYSNDAPNSEDAFSVISSIDTLPDLNNYFVIPKEPSKDLSSKPNKSEPVSRSSSFKKPVQEDTESSQNYNNGTTHRRKSSLLSSEVVGDRSRRKSVTDLAPFMQPRKSIVELTPQMQARISVFETIQDPQMDLEADDNQISNQDEMNRERRNSKLTEPKRERRRSIIAEVLELERRYMSGDLQPNADYLPGTRDEIQELQRRRSIRNEILSFEHRESMQGQAIASSKRRSRDDSEENVHHKSAKRDSYENDTDIVMRAEVLGPEKPNSIKGKIKEMERRKSLRGKENQPDDGHQEEKRKSIPEFQIHPNTSDEEYSDTEEQYARSLAPYLKYRKSISQLEPYLHHQREALELSLSMQEEMARNEKESSEMEKVARDQDIIKNRLTKHQNSVAMEELDAEQIVQYDQRRKSVSMEALDFMVRKLSSEPIPDHQSIKSINITQRSPRGSTSQRGSISVDDGQISRRGSARMVDENSHRGSISDNITQRTPRGSTSQRGSISIDEEPRSRRESMGMAYKSSPRGSISEQINQRSPRGSTSQRGSISVDVGQRSRRESMGIEDGNSRRDSISDRLSQRSPRGSTSQRGSISVDDGQKSRRESVGMENGNSNRGSISHGVSQKSPRGSILVDEAQTTHQVTSPRGSISDEFSIRSRQGSVSVGDSQRSHRNSVAAQDGRSSQRNSLYEEELERSNNDRLKNETHGEERRKSIGAEVLEFITRRFSNASENDTGTVIPSIKIEVHEDMDTSADEEQRFHWNSDRVSEESGRAPTSERGSISIEEGQSSQRKSIGMEDENSHRGSISDRDSHRSPRGSISDEIPYRSRQGSKSAGESQRSRRSSVVSQDRSRSQRNSVHEDDSLKFESQVENRRQSMAMEVVDFIARRFSNASEIEDSITVPSISVEDYQDRKLSQSGSISVEGEQSSRRESIRMEGGNSPRGSISDRASQRSPRGSISDDIPYRSRQGSKSAGESQRSHRSSVISQDGPRSQRNSMLEEEMESYQNDGLKAEPQIENRRQSIGMEVLDFIARRFSNASEMEDSKTAQSIIAEDPRDRKLSQSGSISVEEGQSSRRESVRMESGNSPRGSISDRASQRTPRGSISDDIPSRSRQGSKSAGESQRSHRSSVISQDEPRSQRNSMLEEEMESYQNDGLKTDLQIENRRQSIGMEVLDFIARRFSNASEMEDGKTVQSITDEDHQDRKLSQSESISVEEQSSRKESIRNEGGHSPRGSISDRDSQRSPRASISEEMSSHSRRGSKSADEDKRSHRSSVVSHDGLRSQRSSIYEDAIESYQDDSLKVEPQVENRRQSIGMEVLDFIARRFSNASEVEDSVPAPSIAVDDHQDRRLSQKEMLSVDEGQRSRRESMGMESENSPRGSISDRVSQRSHSGSLSEEIPHRSRQGSESAGDNQRSHRSSVASHDKPISQRNSMYEDDIGSYQDDNLEVEPQVEDRRQSVGMEVLNFIARRFSNASEVEGSISAPSIAVEDHQDRRLSKNELLSVDEGQRSRRESIGMEGRNSPRGSIPDIVSQRSPRGSVSDEIPYRSRQGSKSAGASQRSHRSSVVSQDGQISQRNSMYDEEIESYQDDSLKVEPQVENRRQSIGMEVLDFIARRFSNSSEMEDNIPVSSSKTEDHNNRRLSQNELLSVDKGQRSRRESRGMEDDYSHRSSISDTVGVRSPRGSTSQRGSISVDEGQRSRRESMGLEDGISHRGSISNSQRSPRGSISEEVSQRSRQGSKSAGESQRSHRSSVASQNGPRSQRNSMLEDEYVSSQDSSLKAEVQDEKRRQSIGMEVLDFIARRFSNVSDTESNKLEPSSEDTMNSRRSSFTKEEYGVSQSVSDSYAKSNDMNHEEYRMQDTVPNETSGVVLHRYMQRSISEETPEIIDSVSDTESGSEFNFDLAINNEESDSHSIITVTENQVEKYKTIMYQREILVAKENKELKDEKETPDLYEALYGHIITLLTLPELGGKEHELCATFIPDVTLESSINDNEWTELSQKHKNITGFSAPQISQMSSLTKLDKVGGWATVDGLKDQKNRKSLDSISTVTFCGCGFLGGYLVGAATYIQEHAPHLLQGRLAGSSVGSLIAACIACDVPLRYVRQNILATADVAQKYLMGPFNPFFPIEEPLLKSLLKLIPDDGHIKASGRLYLSLTRATTLTNEIVSEYSSKDELVRALLCCCFLPFISGFTVPSFNGRKYIDGGMSNNMPLKGPKTLTINAFSGEFDICPEDPDGPVRPLMTALNQSIKMTNNNLTRLIHSLLPPSSDLLDKHFEHGYNDAQMYFQPMNGKMKHL